MSLVDYNGALYIHNRFSKKMREVQELLVSKSEEKKAVKKAEIVPPTRSSPTGSQDPKSATWGDLLTKSKTPLDDGRRIVKESLIRR